MKKQFRTMLTYPPFLAVLLLLAFSSCEDVVDVDVDRLPPRLVVEADIEWERGETGQNQTILLSQSTDFFEEEFSPVTTAEVSVTKLNTGEVFPFTHVANGLYETTDFVPEINAEYELIINVNGVEYRATEQLYAVPQVNRVEQNTALGFDGEDVVSIDFFADDPADIENFYYVSHRVNDFVPYISVWDDEFQDGNELQFIYRNSFADIEDDMEPGDIVNMEFMGISEDYYNFIFLLTEQSYSGGDPFASIPVELKGNVVNTSNTDENAFGFFRLSEKVTFDLVVE